MIFTVFEDSVFDAVGFGDQRDAGIGLTRQCRRVFGHTAFVGSRNDDIEGLVDTAGVVAETGDNGVAFHFRHGGIGVVGIGDGVIPVFDQRHTAHGNRQSRL